MSFVLYLIMIHLPDLVLLSWVVTASIKGYSLSFNCLPKMVSRYFCNLLLGLSGIVISINPCSNAGFKYFNRKFSL